MKYHVNDYVGGKNFVSLKVQAAIDGDVPLYAVWNPYVRQNLFWTTEVVFDALKLSKVQPDFEHWNSIKVGDLISRSDANGSNTFVKVIARNGNLVMLSMAPIEEAEDASKKLVDQLGQLADEMGVDEKTKELTTDMITQMLPSAHEHIGIPEIDEAFHKIMTSLLLSHKVSQPTWTDIDELALNGAWKIMRE